MKAEYSEYGDKVLIKQTVCLNLYSVFPSSFWLF